MGSRAVRGLSVIDGELTFEALLARVLATLRVMSTYGRDYTLTAAMSTTSPTRRRWYQFGIIVCAVATVATLNAWIYCQINWIRQRHEIRLRLIGPAWIPGETSHRSTVRKAPGMLWLFGEPAYDWLSIPGADPKEKQRVQLLFPEAEIRQRT